ncbi:HAMP domain-containing methyl-accepting chemotaxis protein [Rhizobium sp. FKL33]|uniref:methyl-accepting chemotaxis protein n=1 Tax=Rhizobium sp. FKL33 TaxID=2562307 RepID=UPI0010BF8892|nr:HAMP domain-containing methyl-accepting chemotaxis protein [Rhizobium sp. FKL33]
MIDKFMSRFKIQTKVIVLVAPFVLSISAVGATGLYASGLLQGRMEISNSVLQSLSGFKTVFASMSDFLRAPSETTHQKAASDVAAQLALLEQTADDLRAETDVTLLTEALEQSKTISSNVETLWGLQTKQNAIMDSVVKAQETLTTVQGDIGKKSFKLIAEAKKKEKAEKKGLNNAVEIDRIATMLDALVVDYAKVLADADKLAVLKKYGPVLEKSAAQLAAALPKAKLPYAKKYEKLLAPVLTQIKSGDVSPAVMTKTNGAINSFRTLATMFKQFGGDLMRQSILNLAAADAQISKADNVANKLRSIVNNNNEIRVVFAELVAKPDEAGVKKVQQSLYMYNTEVQRLASAVKDDPFFSDLTKVVEPVTTGLDKAAAELAVNARSKETEFAAAAQQIDQTWNKLTQFAELQRDSAGAERDQANSISIGAMALGVLIAMAAGAALVITLKGPILAITNAMRRLADGAIDTAITGDRRPDEIGEMARALSVFKNNAQQKIAMQEEAERNRRVSEEERLRNEAEKAETARQVNFAVRALADGLGNLARGELRFTIDTPFAGELDSLRQDFNSSIAGLRNTMSEIRNASDLIQDNGRQMADAADDLAKRTEQQAASLEETAAAVEEITATVKTTSGRAGEAQRIVATAKKNAESSSDIVQNAVSAMVRIRDASDKISQIIDVIDSIAFQTNLLALNAGVEAARAGEAGKGFAVVAQEVRELAQRSAKAAKEIGDLIGNSAQEVSTGSHYVEQTGQALMTIAQQIVEISGHVDLIATSSREQSSSLSEINSTVNAMDQMTQRNAAMVEETNAATRQLSQEADLLRELVARFQLDGANARDGRRAA